MPSLLTQERSSPESESESTESEGIRGGTLIESEGTLESTTVDRIFINFSKGPHNCSEQNLYYLLKGPHYNNYLN